MGGEENRTIEVVAGLLVREGRFLACQRRADGSFPLKWEFPGGKVDEGEIPRGALERELKEELGIVVKSATEVFRHTHLYEERTRVGLIFFKVDRYNGIISNRVFENLMWVEKEGLAALDFLEGDRPLIDLLAHDPEARAKNND